MAGPLETLIFGVRTVRRGLTSLAARSILSFDATQFILTDDEATKSTVVSLSGEGGGGGTPGGSDTQFQFNDEGAFGGTPRLIRNATTSELEYFGEPTHRETRAKFQAGRDASGASFADWNGALSTDASDTTLLDVDVPIAEYGDCCVTIDAMVTVSSTLGRGAMGLRCVWHRIGTAWARVGTDRDTGSGSELTIGTLLRSVDTDSETLSIIGNGAAATEIGWITSYHIQIASTPSL